MKKHPIAYQIGRLFGHSPVLFVVVPVVFGVVLLWPAISEKPAEPQTTSKAQTLKPLDAKTRCQMDRAKIFETYQADMAAGNHWKAFSSVKHCADLLKDDELTAMAVKAELKGRLLKARDTQRTPADRLAAIEAIERTNKDQAQEFVAIKARLKKTIAQEEAKARKALVALKRSQGVTIGMSEKDVLDSSWGRPQKINRTILRHGTREQWVYEGFQYLYLEDGVLTGIQTNE